MSLERFVILLRRCNHFDFAFCFFLCFSNNRQDQGVVGFQGFGRIIPTVVVVMRLLFFFFF